MTSDRIAIAIDQTTNDIYFDDDGNLVMVTKALAVGQHARARLQTFFGEWFLDTSIGVPWLTQILGQRYDPALAEAVVKAAILGTDGVTGITSFSVTFDRGTRGALVRSVNVTTDYDVEVAI